MRNMVFVFPDGQQTDAANDVVKVVGMVVQLRPFQGNAMIGDCPFCKAEGMFVVRPWANDWSCQAVMCGRRGNASRFVRAINKAAECENQF